MRWLTLLLLLLTGEAHTVAGFHTVGDLDELLYYTPLVIRAENSAELQKALRKYGARMDEHEQHFRFKALEVVHGVRGRGTGPESGNSLLVNWLPSMAHVLPTARKGGFLRWDHPSPEALARAKEIVLFLAPRATAPGREEYELSAMYAVALPDVLPRVKKFFAPIGPAETQAGKELAARCQAAVIGRVHLMSTRDGQIGQLEVVDEVWGNVYDANLRFSSAPMALEQKVLRLWFLKKDREKSWILLNEGNTSSLPASAKEDVLKWVSK